MFSEELPYTPDTALLAEAVADRPWSILLDSGPECAHGGRYDILVADPRATLITRGEMTRVEGFGAPFESVEDPFNLLRQALAETPRALPEGLPFAGGAVGYFGYDLCRRLESLPSLAADHLALPEMAVGLYHWALVVDHRLKRSFLVGDGARERAAELKALFSARPASGREPFRAASAVGSNLSKAAYNAAFERIKSYLREGDCYQVNFAQCFGAAVMGDPWAGYRRLRAFSPSPFGAYLNLPFAQLLSASPERFLQVKEGRVETRPIKGTRPRSPDPATDAALGETLRRSEKDRAENLMIVDLLRNDLGKSCIPGTVRVPELFAVESFATVHHLVSTVQGELAPGSDGLALLRGCFPGGSITGAPKVRAMEIIEQLEPNRRGVYCGAIGYIDFGGNMDTNIAIRTLVHKHGKAHFWAGGGIVHDSEPEAEYRETLDKAAAMMRLLGAV